MGIGSLVCIINFLIAPVANVLMKLGCHGKGSEDLTGTMTFFQSWKVSS